MLTTFFDKKVESHIQIRAEPIFWEDKKVELEFIWKHLKPKKSYYVLKEYPALVALIYKKNIYTNNDWCRIGSSNKIDMITETVDNKEIKCCVFQEFVISNKSLYDYHGDETEIQIRCYYSDAKYLADNKKGPIDVFTQKFPELLNREKKVFPTENGCEIEFRKVEERDYLHFHEFMQQNWNFTIEAALDFTVDNGGPGQVKDLHNNKSNVSAPNHNPQMRLLDLLVGVIEAYRQKDD